MKKTNEEFIRDQVRKILNEDLSWGTDDALFGGGPELDVFNTLITPFTDVFKVAFVAAKDITSAMIDIADYAITFNPEKQANIKERFRQRREKYKGQMAKAMASTDAAFQGEDAKLFTFMAAPGLVLGKAAANLTWDAGEPVRDKVDEFFGGTLGIGDTAIAATTAADKSPGLMADLKRAFFGEGLDEVDAIEAILLEQEAAKDNAAPSDQELQDLAQEYLEKSGMDKEIKAFWDNLIEDKSKEIDEILKEQKEKIDLFTQLSMAGSMDEAESIVSALSALGVDLSGPLGEVKQALVKEVERIKAGGEDVEEMLEDLKKHPDAASIAKDAPVEEYFPLIEKGLLVTSFGEAVDDVKKAGVGDLLGFVAEMTEDDLKKLSEMNPRGKEYADLIFSFRDELLSL